MIVDRRAGSRDLFAPLQQARIRPLELGDLHYGDVQIQGNGPEGCPWNIGIEYKKLPDLVQSIDTGRLVGHQLPGMLECFNESWLLMEGDWKIGRHGEVLVKRDHGYVSLRSGTSNAFLASSLQGFLLTCQIRLGIKVWHTTTQEMTVAFLSALNRWWTEKDYDKHRSHLAFDTSSALTLISRPNLVRRVAKELPGIGWERSGAVSRHFGSTVEMVTATQSEWEGIDGIGRTMASRIVKALEGEEK
jgi:ERCC4-type nuclease